MIVAIGRLNVALALSNGWSGTCPTGTDASMRLSGNYREDWEGKQWMELDGTPLGPVEVFEILSGLVDVGLDRKRLFTPADAERASQELGRRLRLALARSGVDWVTDALPDMPEGVHALVEGETLPCDELPDAIPAISELLEETPDDTWADIEETLRKQVNNHQLT